MKQVMLSVFDKKVGTYMPPFFSTHVAHGVRSVTDFISKGEGAPSKYPGDFALYNLGEWDDSNAVLKPHQPPELVVEFASLIKKP